MRFAIAITLLLPTIAAAATTTAGGGNDNPGLNSHRTQDILVQRYNVPFDTNAVQGSGDLHIPTQTQNQTPEAHVQKRTDSSTPGTQIMRPWRQVIGGIAVAVLVAVV